MSEKEIFDFKSLPRLEQVGEKRANKWRMAIIVLDDALIDLTTQIRPDVIFGNDSDLRPRTMYLETVDWATSNPSISSSPWIRGAPLNGFSLLICESARSRDRALFNQIRYLLPIGAGTPRRNTVTRH